MQLLRLQDDKLSGGYLPFDNAKAIFVHIPKCAGISVNKALFKSIAGGHTQLDQYINVFPPSKFLSYFKFTIVRNPWDRLVSAYTFLAKGGMNEFDDAFFKAELASFGSFENFVNEWLTEDNINKYHHFKPQWTYIIDRHNKVTVDYIGYLELLEDDFDFIAGKLGTKGDLKKDNVVKRADYRDFYDEKTKAKAAKIYAKDIDLLNYSFDGVIEPVRTIQL